MEQVRMRARQLRREEEIRKRKELLVKKRRLKLTLKLCVLLVILLSAGFVGYEFFIDTQTMGCRISIFGEDVSRLTPDEAAQKLETSFGEKQIYFYEDGEKVYTATLKELGYSFNLEHLEQALAQKRDERLKSRGIVEKREDLEVTYEIVKDEVEQAMTLTEENLKISTERKASEDAFIDFDTVETKFVVVIDQQGNQIDQNKLMKYTADYLEKSLAEKYTDDVIIMEINSQVYKAAEITAASEDLNSKVNELNANIEKYKNTSITYLFGDTTETIDSTTISSWLIVSEDKVEIDLDQVWSYVEELGNKYNTIYVPRYFQTSGGQTVEVSNNEYGFRINQDAEFEQLCADLESGQAIQRAPVYEKEGMTRNGTDDLIGSYIEVSLERQYLWLYKNGSLVTETDIISGLPTEDRATYTGAYSIAYKASPFTLTSDIYGYNTEVTYWMPFVYGQGLHDADWQPVFGGEVYKTNGSHGCINLPPYQAEIIYNAIEGGYPIIIY